MRRDITGNQPVVASRLLAREILAAVGTATKPNSVVEAVVEALGSSKVRRGLPGWNSLSAVAPGTTRVHFLLSSHMKAARKDRGRG